MTTAHDELLELLDLEVDGAIGEENRKRLVEAMSKEPSLAAERRRLELLRNALEADRAPVDEGFTRRVMEALPEPAWARRRAGSWRVAVALFAVLATIGGLLMAAGIPESAAASPVVGTFAAVGDFLVASVLSGAGLLAASWRGIGLALEEMLGVGDLLLFGLGVVAVNGLLLLLLRSSRRRPAAEQADRRRDE